ncbi:hypothetical protein SAMN02745249_00797 [Atopostipes suicloacalis DSM 15692]|uniref:Uncharacterized protein n=1 Tax=Atopostipes suicloacalis DSM 15692 TaxID=1121025 RepID=A0A1M4V1I4_9LACT|nr:hypothetical protein SAMN02745249_00797 [Atopostipes suicloacalis DSM 15692]
MDRGSTLNLQNAHAVCLKTLLETYAINARAREHLLLLFISMPSSKMWFVFTYRYLHPP